MIKKITPRKLAIDLARWADKKKAHNIVILDLQKILSITDFFIICSGRNKKQTQAIADHLREKAKTLSISLLGQEGYKEGSWVLLDFGEMVVHVFHEETRGFYDLEFLWSEAPRIRWHTSRRKS